MLVWKQISKIKFLIAYRSQSNITPFNIIEPRISPWFVEKKGGLSRTGDISVFSNCQYNRKIVLFPPRPYLHYSWFHCIMFTRCKNFSIRQTAYFSRRFLSKIRNNGKNIDFHQFSFSFCW